MEPALQPQFTSYTGVTTGKVNVVGGAITLNNSSDGTFKVANSGGSVFGIKQVAGELKINSVGGNVTLEIPQGVNLNLNNVGGVLTDNRGASAGGGSIAQVLPSGLSALSALRFSSAGGYAASSASSSSSSSASVAVSVGGFSTSISSVVVTQQSDQTFQNVAKIELMNQRGNVEILASPDSSVRVLYGNAVVDLGKKQCLDITNRPGSQMTIYAPKDLEIETMNQMGTVLDKRHQQ